MPLAGDTRPSVGFAYTALTAGLTTGELKTGMLCSSLTVSPCETSRAGTLGATHSIKSCETVRPDSSRHSVPPSPSSMRRTGSMLESMKTDQNAPFRLILSPIDGMVGEVNRFALGTKLEMLSGGKPPWPAGHKQVFFQSCNCPLLEEGPPPAPARVHHVVASHTVSVSDLKFRPKYVQHTSRSGSAMAAAGASGSVTSAAPSIVNNIHGGKATKSSTVQSGDGQLLTCATLRHCATDPTRYKSGWNPTGLR